MLFANWKNEILKIPNLLSLCRLVLIPVYIIIYLNADSNEDYLLAAMILAVSCLTDLIDGKIARHFNLISNLGKLLDPLADKATQFTLILCLSIRYPSIIILIGIFVIKESFQLIAGSILLRKGRMLKGAQLTGKVCTTVLFISLILIVMIPSLSEDIVNIIVAIDSVFMVIAFVDYIYVYYHKKNKFQSITDPNS